VALENGHDARYPLEGPGVSIPLLLRQLENHHHRFLLENKDRHLADRANLFFYSLKQPIHSGQGFSGDRRPAP